jgi:hypothetical protein
MTTEAEALERVIALKASRKAELLAEAERQRLAERAALERDAADFERAVAGALAAAGAEWLAEFRDPSGRFVSCGTSYGRRLCEVRFYVPGHRTVSLVLASHSGGYEPAGASCDGWQTWQAREKDSPDTTGHDSLADALIAADEVPF